MSGGAGGAAGVAGSGGGAGSAGGTSGVQIPGMTSEVAAVYDEFGFLHLTCGNDNDCFAAMGYFHASNRFFFMDFVRHLVRGQLGAIVLAGSTVLDLDYENRVFFSTPEGKPLEIDTVERAEPSTKEAIAAYSKGVNAWLEDVKAQRNGATLTEEYGFAVLSKDPPRAWEPEDSAAVGLYVMRDLSEGSGSEIYLANVLAKLDPKFTQDLLSLRPLYEVSTLSASGADSIAPPPPPPPSLFAPQVKARMESMQNLIAPLAAGLDPARLAEKRAIGSNNWALAASRTSGKKPLLSNDPHLALSNPSIWFPIEVDARTKGTGTYHVAGGSFPGLPLILTGHNEDLAWGVTTTYYDLTDVYTETLSDDGKSVKFKGQDVPLLEKNFDFYDSSTKQTITKTFRWVPHHGPIIKEDAEKKQALSVRWVAQGGITDFDGFLGIGRAASTVEAREALKKINSSSQNFVVADKKGDIGWFPYVRMPSRPWASAELPPWLPLPGDGTAEWDGFLDVADLPQMFNPPKGFIATANQEMTGASFDGDPTNDGQKAYQAWDKAEGARQQRIVDLLDAGGDTHTTDSMRTIQGDTHVLMAESIVPALIEAAKGSDDAGAKEVADALAAWKFSCPTGLAGEKKDSDKSSDAAESADSIGCSAFHVTLYALNAAALDDELSAAGVSVSSVDRAVFLARVLAKPETVTSGEGFWDNVTTTDATETRDDILRQALVTAGAALGKLGGKDEWRWGRLHTLTLRSIFDNFGIGTYNYSPVATPGGLNTVNVATPSSPSASKPLDLFHNNGPSLRTVIEIDEKGPHMEFQYPGGADLHRDSPFYNNLVSRWIKNEPVPFAFGGVANPSVQVTVSPAP